MGFGGGQIHAGWERLATESVTWLYEYVHEIGRPKQRPTLTIELLAAAYRHGHSPIHRPEV